MQFSLRMLLALTAMAGLACAAVMNESWYWVAGFGFIVGVIMLAAPVIAIVGRNRARSFACGFAVVAWIYAFTGFHFVYLADLAPSPHWFVTELAFRVAETLPPSDRQPPPTGFEWPLEMLMMHHTGAGTNAINVARCYSVFHSFAALFFGGLGGCLAIYVGRSTSNEAVEKPSS
jgi:hypothetical protein